MKDNNYEKIIEQYESIYNKDGNNGYNKYYNLKQAGKLLNISYRSMKILVKPIYQEHQGSGNIYKSGGMYFISYRLLDLFKLLKRRKNSALTIYSHEWTSNISWTTVDFYGETYHTQIFEDLKALTPEVNYLGCVELDKNGRNHIHLLADTEPQQLRPILSSILNDYLDSDKFYRVYCEDVKNKGASVEYLLKNPQLLLNNTEYKF